MSVSLDLDNLAVASVVPETRIVLRRFRTSPHEVIAMMPDVPAGKAGLCNSYTTSGGIGGVDYRLTMLGTLHPDLRDEDVLATIDGLRANGYRPAVMIRPRRPKLSPQ